jgi:galactokinase
MQEVAEFACTCERYVGTQSGGMDQAISIMGMNGVAKLINFDPVRTSFAPNLMPTILSALPGMNTVPLITSFQCQLCTQDLLS